MAIFGRSFPIPHHQSSVWLYAPKRISEGVSDSAISVDSINRHVVLSRSLTEYATSNDTTLQQYAYVTNVENPGVVSQILVGPGTVLNSVTVGNNPTGLAVTPSGEFLYVANQNDGTVSVVNTTTMTVVTTITVGSLPLGVACSPDGTKIYVANEGGGSISVISTATNTVTTTITGLSEPQYIAFTPNGQFAYVTDGGINAVWPITVSTSTLGTSITLAHDPLSITVNPAGTYVYVGLLVQNSLCTISTSTNTIQGYKNTPSAEVTSLVVSKDGTKLYTAGPPTSGPYNVVAIWSLSSPSSPTLTTSFSLTSEGAAEEVALTSDGNTLYVALGSPATSPNMVATTLGSTPIQTPISTGTGQSTGGVVLAAAYVGPHRVELPRAIADAAASVDSLHLSRLRASATDNAVATDVAVPAVGRFRSLADSAVEVDAIARGVNNVRNVSDPATLADDLTSLIHRSTGDSADSSDSVTWLYEYYRSTFDAAVESDHTSRAFIQARATSDNATSVDGSTGTSRHHRVTSDSAVESDTVARFDHSFRVVVDHAVETDVVRPGQTFARSLADSSAAVDGPVRIVYQHRKTSDVADTVDVLTWNAPIISRACYDFAISVDSCGYWQPTSLDCHDYNMPAQRGTLTNLFGTYLYDSNRKGTVLTP